MSDTVIKVENLGKKYVIGHKQTGQSQYKALRDVLADGAKAIGRYINPLSRSSSKGTTKEDFWALRDVSFEIKQGDRVGIIGRNGAGKSTLLKILSRITEPTTGRIFIKGRVASLLEVGTGFHPELTGRENIYLNGAVLGMGRLEIKRKFEEIVNFAEVEQFLDTPVKRYSSGMYVRLAFAVAAHLEPEILVVDEVLAVGDAQFQKKCLGKIEEVGKSGRTVLFVSHNMSVLRSLCNNSILLSSGSLNYQGETSKAVETYLNTSIASQRKGEICWKRGEKSPGTEAMKLRSIRLIDCQFLPRESFEASEKIHIEISYDLLEAVRGMRVVLQVINAEGIIVFSSTDHSIRDNRREEIGYYQTVCTLPSDLMNEGIYYIKIHAGCPGVRVLVKGEEFVSFKIEKSINHGSSFSEKWPGIVAPRMKWELKKVLPSESAF